mmetsp:Transcript_15951/g.45579  ORF Transcript_15951/g.45579 Transcript_15951/m.45579 type:complete len:219 (-) Transcript_15951:550-1206(-)
METRYSVTASRDSKWHSLMMRLFIRRQASIQTRAQAPCVTELRTSTSTKLPSKSTTHSGEPMVTLSARERLMRRMPWAVRPQLWRSREVRRAVRCTTRASALFAICAFCRRRLPRSTSRPTPDFGSASQIARAPAPVIRQPSSSSSLIHGHPGSASASTAAPVSCRGWPESFRCLTKGASRSAAQSGTSSRFVSVPSTSSISSPRDRPRSAPPLGVRE